jgi:hypothetical protein
MAPYVPWQTRWTLPAGYLCVRGDTRPASVDSRNWGFLDIDTVIGQAVFGSWPPNTWGRFSG